MAHQAPAVLGSDMNSPFNVAMDYIDREGKLKNSVVHSCDLNMRGLHCPLAFDIEMLKSSIPPSGRLEMYAIKSDDPRFFNNRS